MGRRKELRRKGSAGKKEGRREREREVMAQEGGGVGVGAWRR